MIFKIEKSSHKCTNNETTYNLNFIQKIFFFYLPKCASTSTNLFSLKKTEKFPTSIKT